MRVTPKMSESPEAMRKSTIACARPDNSWIRISDGDMRVLCRFRARVRAGSADPFAPTSMPPGRGAWSVAAARRGPERVVAGPRPARTRNRRCALVPDAHLLHFVVRGQDALAGDVLVVDDDPDAALGVELGRADPRTHRRLPVRRAEADQPARRLDREPAERGNELIGVRRARLPDRLGDREARDAAVHRAAHRGLV